MTAQRTAAALTVLAALAATPAFAQTNLNDVLGDELQDQGPPVTEASPSQGGGEQGWSGGGDTFETSGDTATKFQQVARQYEQAVGVVVLVIPDGEGGYDPQPVGTAWAFAPNMLATNAHVAQPVIQMLQYGVKVYVLPNRSRGQQFEVVAATSHPRYADPSPNAQGRTPVGGATYDIGVLQIDGQFPVTVDLAEEEDLRALDSGTPVAYVGFPMENLQGGNVNIQNPIATMQTGILTSVSDWYLEDTGFESNKLLRHNLPATGGASGSPIFLPNGEVVGALNAGNINMVEFSVPGAVIQYRIPSAAQINYAQRIDILQDLLASQ